MPLSPNVYSRIEPSDPQVAVESPAPGDVGLAVQTILEVLDFDPGLAATLIPGFLIVRKRAAHGTHLPETRRLRSSLNSVRRQRVAEVVERERRLNPSIGFRELATALNDEGLTTYRGYPFTYSRIQEHLARVRRAATRPTPQMLADPASIGFNQRSPSS